MKQSKTISKKESKLYVVGVGASAGGLDALTKFLKNFNGANVDICIVIVMHLSPDYKSQLAPILDKRCKWPVITAENNMSLTSRHIYVTPQNKQIRIVNNALALEDLSPEHAFTPSIDNFFESLARDKGKRAIGVILSGFGKDGSHGISAIRQRNGFTIAQLPETAEHKDMPSAAIQTSHVDLIVPAEQMFDDIVQFITNSHAIATSDSNRGAVDAIFELLEKRSGTDFSMYKPTTIMRRINHRISSLQLSSMNEYYELIKEQPRELDNLFDAVLIGVTEFFRDLEAFDHLKQQLTEMLKNKEPGDSIRIWSVGCATGEEPYSICILLYELLGSRVSQYHIQIFASDIDERAINFGRKAIYHRDSLKNVPAQIVENYFEQKDTLHFELTKEIKQHTLFTRHDVTNDPPFVKLDLVVCRNLLIYFNNDLQKQSFQIFHYALKPGGLLFLGKSESVSVAADLFTKIGKGKMYKKAETALGYQLKFSRFRSQKKQIKEEEKKNNIRNMSVVDVAKETLYYKYDSPFVIINEQAEIKEVHGSLRLYMEVSQGSMNVNLHKMVNTEFTTVLKAVHAQVKKTNVTHTSHVVRFELYDQTHYVRIKIIPLVYRISDVQYYMVIFEKVEPSEGQLELQKKLETTDFVNLRIKELEDELASTKEHLQIFTEELEATNEELQTINEELQSSNEELKSSNEELETSNEELQSANEELNTANQELRLTNDLLIDKEKELKAEKEVSQRNESIYKTISENIPDGAIGILNNNLEIEYIAGKGVDEMDAEEMIGQVMPDINPSKKEAKKIRALCEQTLKGKPGHLEIRYNDRFYEIRTVLINMPFSEEKKVLYIAHEVTQAKLNQIMFETAVTGSDIIVFEVDLGTDIVKPNKKLSQYLGIDPRKKLTSQMIEDKVHPDDKSIRSKSIKAGLKTGKLQHEIRLQVKNDLKYVRITGTIIYENKKKPTKAFLTLLDISKDKRLVQRALESEARFKTIANSVPITLWITDKEGMCTYINKQWLAFTGSTLEENLGRGWLQFMHEDDTKQAEESYVKAHQTKSDFRSEYRAKRADGSYIWHLNQGVPEYDNNGEFKGYIGSFVNIHEQKEFMNQLEKKVNARTRDLTRANEELVKLNMNLEEFAYMASHDLKEPLRKIRTFNSIIKGKIKEENTEVLNYSKKIEDSAGRLTDLINNILMYTKIEKNVSKHEPIDLNKILENVKTDYDILLTDNNVVLQIPALGKVQGVAIQLYQLFSNLIMNAVKFNESESPLIQLTSEVVKGNTLNKSLQANTKINFRKICVIDNGIGFDNDKKEYIFKPFKRLSGLSDYTGTGIGLAICKRIMDIHNGYIDVNSKKGEGATFIVYFPSTSKS